MWHGISPSPGADVARGQPQSRCRCGEGLPQSRCRCGEGLPQSRCRCDTGQPQSRCSRCGGGEPQSRCRCGTGVSPGPGADVARGDSQSRAEWWGRAPVPVQMWAGSPVPAALVDANRPVRAVRRRREERAAVVPVDADEEHTCVTLEDPLRAVAVVRVPVDDQHPAHAEAPPRMRRGQRNVACAVGVPVGRSLTHGIGGRKGDLVRARV